MGRSFYNAVLTETFKELERFFKEFTEKYKHGYLMLELDFFTLRLSHYEKLSYCIEDIAHAIDRLEGRFYHVAVYKVCKTDGDFNVVRVFFLEDELLCTLKDAVDENGNKLGVLEKFYKSLDETHTHDLCRIEGKFRDWIV